MNKEKSLELKKTEETKESAKIETSRELTCKNCIRRDICEYADDPYNTDGDCLWIK